MSSYKEVLNTYYIFRTEVWVWVEGGLVLVCLGLGHLVGSGSGLGFGVLGQLVDCEVQHVFN